MQGFLSLNLPTNSSQGQVAIVVRAEVPYPLAIVVRAEVPYPPEQPTKALFFAV